MIKRINDFLAGWPMTIVGGVFLLASFILPRTRYPAGEALAWVCVVICGIPLLYLAIWRVIFNKGISKISSALLISLAMTADLDITAAGEVERDLASILFGMEDVKEGVEAFLAKRPANWQGR